MLNRGLNFSILPEKLNFTQVLVDLAKFERLMEWKEFWHDKPADEPYVPPLFKKQKHNRPKNPSPTPLNNVEYPGGNFHVYLQEASNGCQHKYQCFQ